MHIIGDDQPARECAICHINTTRQLYGANNTPICMLCKGKLLRAAQDSYRLGIREKPPQAIDAWKPGDPV